MFRRYDIRLDIYFGLISKYLLSKYLLSKYL